MKGHTNIFREDEIRVDGLEEPKSATFYIDLMFRSFTAKCVRFMFMSSIYYATISQIPHAQTYNTNYICICLKFCDANSLCVPVEKTRVQLALASFLIKRA